jgi:hypothetical protein
MKAEVKIFGKSAEEGSAPKETPGSRGRTPGIKKFKNVPVLK